MKILEIPFNKFVGLKRADNEDDYIFRLEPDNNHLNHLGTIHASALFALAEASGGEFLLNQFKDYKSDIIPVVRKVEVKYSKPANGIVFSKACIPDADIGDILNELQNKNRVIIKVRVDLYNINTEKLFTSTFDWFITKK